MRDPEERHPETCENTKENLVLYYYGECTDAERNETATHLKGCASCRHFLEDLRKLLPLTVRPDEPPQAFWDAYSREMREKLAAAEERVSWWKGLGTFLRPWPVRAIATALTLSAVLTVTFTARLWRSPILPPEEQVLLEVLPMAENLEFFEAMEFLDSMDLLETIGAPGDGSA
jgi:hypothetical protein